MKTSRIVILLLVAVVAVGAAGCKNDDSASTGKTVAYSSPGDSNGWFLAFSSELKREAGDAV